MKINTEIHAVFVQTDGREHPLEIKGFLTAPDRPLKGERILWPYASTEVDIEECFVSGCELVVDSSGWVTVSQGKIVPFVILIHECKLDNLDEVDSLFMGARLLLSEPSVKFPYNNEWVTLPEKVKDFPLPMIQNMPAE